jgi:hypothetical protein
VFLNQKYYRTNLLFNLYFNQINQLKDTYLRDHR